MKLQVLMSSYNGEKYIREQLDSILNQTLFKDHAWTVTLVVRDDGSTDATCEILEEYAGRYPACSYIAGENIGVVASFYQLITLADRDADYIALADQDDIWMPDKLEAAVRRLDAAETTKPLLYCSRCQSVDEQLHPLEGVFFPAAIRPSFGNALVENICTGCTAVFNQELVRLAALEYSKEIEMHDWWLYLFASCFGTVLYDETPHMYYRQHTGNTVGVSRSYRQELLHRIRRFRKNRYHISRQVSEFLRICHEQGEPIEPQYERWMKLIVASRRSLPARFQLLRDKQIYRQRKGDTFIFKVIMLTGTL